jgi:hypothetical protein
VEDLHADDCPNSKTRGDRRQNDVPSGDSEQLIVSSYQRSGFQHGADYARYGDNQVVDFDPANSQLHDGRDEHWLELGITIWRSDGGLAEVCLGLWS